MSFAKKNEICMHEKPQNPTERSEKSNLFRFFKDL